ncbi:unnamed protein product [Amoebophrya sp. A25]|nr:unnamed protein product [Amoebophrya sp. A25]|eukprot:GSA25T00012682001.1
MTSSLSLVDVSSRPVVDVAPPGSGRAGLLRSRQTFRHSISANLCEVLAEPRVMAEFKQWPAHQDTNGSMLCYQVRLGRVRV